MRDRLVLDGDGADDLSQADMHCILLPDGSDWTCLQNGESYSVSEFYRLDGDTIADEEGRPDDLPYGLFGFRLNVDAPGDTVTVTKYYSAPLPANVSWYKHDTVNGWFDYSDAVTIGGDRRSVAIRLTDGGGGDADGVANGVIVDPSGPASLPVDGDGGGGGGGGCFIATATTVMPGVLFVTRHNFVQYALEVSGRGDHTV